MNATHGSPLSPPELFDISDRARLADALAVRFAVFVDEQHVPAEEEVDEHDRTDPAARHAVIRAGAAVVAAGRYYRSPEGSAQIGRMAVLANARGRGIGRVLLDALVADARARGYAQATLNAQDHAVGFYAKAGFSAFGETLVECDIVHQPMMMSL
jgi:predicted GNAT family N-acyltransferase